MRKEGNLMLGTIEEIVKEATRDCFIDGRLASRSVLHPFHQFDFAAEFEEQKDALETVESGATGWYGIIRITEFYSDNLDLFGDYYGGECGVYRRLLTGTPEEECRKMLEDMLLEMLSIEYGKLNSKEVLFAKFRK